MIGVVNKSLRRVPAWLLYILAPLPVAWLFYLALNGQLGVDPTKVIEHRLGLWSLWGLIAGLAVTPLRKYLGLNLLKFRRAIGLITFFYILCHLLVWLVLDVQLLSQIWADILERPYVTVGMAGFALTLPLAVTSNNGSVRRLGAARWRRLHKLTYAIALLGAVHFLMLVKGFQWEPVVYLGVILLLLLARLDMARMRSRLAPG